MRERRCVVSDATQKPTTETPKPAIHYLYDISVTLRQILALLQAQVPPVVATDADLDGKYGDPILKFMPRDWSGEDCRQRRFSECPPPLLDLVADANDYFARKADESEEKTEKGTPVSKYKRADAARARGWAKRLRTGWTGGAAAVTAAAGVQAAARPSWATPVAQPEEDEVPF